MTEEDTVKKENITDWTLRAVDSRRQEAPMHAPTSEAHARALKPGVAEKSKWDANLRKPPRYDKENRRFLDRDDGDRGI